MNKTFFCFVYNFKFLPLLKKTVKTVFKDTYLPLYAHNVILTCIRRRPNVMDVVKASNKHLYKQCYNDTQKEHGSQSLFFGPMTIKKQIPAYNKLFEFLTVEVG